MSKTSRSFEPVRWLVINNREQLQEVIQALIQEIQGSINSIIFKSGKDNISFH